MTWTRYLAVGAVLAMAVLLAHGPSLGAGFLRFDDDRIVTANPLFEAPFFEALGALLHPGRTVADAYLPVAHLSLWFDWKILGPHPFGLHLANLAWHFLACLALFSLARRLGLPPFGALIAALLFSVHPALAEPVAWVSGRKCLLAGLLSFLALRFWLEALSGSWRAGIGSVLCTLLAVYSNGAALVLFPWILALSLFVGGTRRAPFPWLPLGLIGLVCVGAALHHSWLAAREGTAGAAFERPLLLAVGSFGWYLGHALVPLRLSSDYPYAVYKDILGNPGFLALLLAFFPLLAGFFLWVFRRRLGRFPRAVCSVGLLLFFLGLAPFNNVFPASAVLLADRYLYLPLAGLVLAAGSLLALPGRWALGPACLLGLLVVLAVPTTRARSAQFKDDATLWGAALVVEPASPVARFNLVTDRLQRGGRAALKGDGGRRIREDLNQAFQDAHRPELRARILAQMAVVRSWSGDPAGAAQRLVQAMLEIDLLPATDARMRAWGRFALDRLRFLREAGLDDEAAHMVEQIRALLPRWPEGAIGLASFQVLEVEELIRLGRRSEAEVLAREVKAKLERIMGSGPASFSALLALARVEATRVAGGSFVNALARLKDARALEPGRIESYIEAANLYQQLDPPQPVAAMDELNLGLARRPGDPDLLLRKGHLLITLNRIEAGIHWIEQAFSALPGRDDIRDYLIQALLIGLDQALKDRAREDPARWLRRLQAIDRFHPEVLGATGRTLAAAGKLLESLDYFEQALAQGARSDETRAQLVEALKKLGYQYLLVKRDQAFEFFHRAVSLASDQEDLQAVRDILDGEVRRLYLLLRQQPLASGEACRFLARARRLVLPQIKPTAALVLDLEEFRRREEDLPESVLMRAQEVLEAELVGSLTPERLSSRVRGWLAEGQSSRALWLLELVGRVAKPFPLQARLLALTHLARGEFAQARSVLGQALESWPDDQELEEELGRLVCQEALAHWQAEPAKSVLEDLVEGARLCRRLFSRERLEPLLARVDTLLRNEALLALESADQARDEGEWERASALYARGVRLMPPGVEPEFRFHARMLQALCWQRLGQPMRALDELEALDLEARGGAFPFSPVVLERAALLFALDRPVEGRQVLETWLAAFPEAPGHPDVRILLLDQGR